ncbi:MAG: segregation/condensation protein A, partial [Lachnospiraceae bacterium]|nr:segregation/condensation protein A [Lachnospiraceae bacterium]
YKEKVNVEELMADVTLAKLQKIFQSVIKKQVEKLDPIRSEFGKIEKEEVTLSDRMLYIQRYATKYGKNARFSFRNLLEAQSSKVETIVTFLGILELMKIGVIQIEQEELFDEIYINFTGKEVDLSDWE